MGWRDCDIEIPEYERFMESDDTETMIYIIQSAVGKVRELGYQVTVEKGYINVKF